MRMKILLGLAVAWLSSEIVSAATDKVVCYHGTWSRYRNGNGQFTVSDIDPTLCTHIIYSFVGINTDGTINLLDRALDITNGNFANFVSLKKRNSKVKTLVAVGGWNEGSLKYSNVAASSSLRANFIQSALNLVQTYKFDGFDLDWEYPGQRGGAAADIVSVAEISYLDIINVMAYDFHGSWDGVTGQNAPLYASSIETGSTRLLNVDAAIRGWIQRGADPQKIALGLGVYGRSYTLSSSSNTALGAPVSGAGNQGPYTGESGMLGYNEICELQRGGGWTTVWDEQQKVPYTYKGNQWVGYDNPKSIAIKVNYAKSLNLGGVMIWSIETEDFRGICGPKYPLLNAIRSALGTLGESNDDDTANEPPAEEPPAQEPPAEESPAEEPPADDGTAPADGGSTDLCTKAGYVRDPLNCNIFYYCLPVGTSYVPLKQQCNSGLYFDEAAQTCNWPQLVSGC
ncbi:hypothetical protein NQ314_019257 [Rhamnusium bicolor]|uniref:chitinase n=1 Tax=Rhamnusium bicolor TaxID=1586634 RepID=A0AAV8WNB6_9CUCU|nr:hypothetical protein NQ314_019257 [Rhamnusium bicolor]